jgi:hypothetical protein
MPDERPLWRVSTRDLMDALAARAEGQRVQRTMLREMPLTLILDEITRRGWGVTPPYVGDLPFDGEAEQTALYKPHQRNKVAPSLLHKQWPKEGGDE